jgi:hypothetical protein
VNTTGTKSATKSFATGKAKPEFSTASSPPTTDVRYNESVWNIEAWAG